MTVNYRLPGDAKFLLSFQVLLDLCGTESNPAKVWLKSVPAERIRLSVLTVALARVQVRRGGDLQEGERLSARLADLLAKFRADGGAPLLFIEGSATAWQSFMLETSLGAMSQIDRQFYAAAFNEGLCVVEYEGPHTAALAPLGIKVHSLGVRP